MDKKYNKSPMNYSGNKYKLLPQITELFPERIDTFYDLFSGGLDVTNNVKANKKIDNDIDANLIDIYKYLQKQSSEQVIRKIERIIKKYNLSKTNQDGYYKLRDVYNNSEKKSPILLLVLMFYAFNNQIRFNKSGEYNVAFGKNRSSFNKSIRKNLEQFVEDIKNVKFKKKDFRKYKIKDFKKNDFVYLDPPYLISQGAYSAVWTEKEEKSLYRFLDRLNKKGIRFALSNVIKHKGKTNHILEKWAKKKGYYIHYLETDYYNCSYQKKDKTSPTIEVLITNYINKEDIVEKITTIIDYDVRNEKENHTITDKDSNIGKQILYNANTQDFVFVNNLPP